jgi:hypothetical protein
VLASAPSLGAQMKWALECGGRNSLLLLRGGTGCSSCVHERLRIGWMSARGVGCAIEKRAGERERERECRGGATAGQLGVNMTVSRD